LRSFVVHDGFPAAAVCPPDAGVVVVEGEEALVGFEVLALEVDGEPPVLLGELDVPVVPLDPHPATAIARAVIGITPAA
jgi:hypothetical protein